MTTAQRSNDLEDIRRLQAEVERLEKERDAARAETKEAENEAVERYEDYLSMCGERNIARGDADDAAAQRDQAVLLLRTSNHRHGAERFCPSQCTRKVACTLVRRFLASLDVQQNVQPSEEPEERFVPKLPQGRAFDADRQQFCERVSVCRGVGGCSPSTCFCGSTCARHGCDWPDEKGGCLASKEKVR